MIKHKFKKGDRVRFVGRGLVPSGCLGTVDEDDAYPYVDWAGFTGGYQESPTLWPVFQDDLELVEPSVAAFKVGQRVRATKGGWTDFEGVVVESNYHSYVAVEPHDGGKFYFYPKDLTSIEQAPASPPKPECYVTAWVEEGDFHLTDFHLTGDVLVSKQDADYSAKLLAQSHPGKEAAVFKLVSKHSSAVTVTSEDV